jgi:hypothetical protein
VPEAREAAVATVMALGLLAGAAGCSQDGGGAPTHLLDGSPAAPPPVVLDAPMPQIGTKADAVATSRVAKGSLAARCVASAPADTSHGPAVERIGATGVSVTFRTASALLGCDGDTDPGVGDSRWCGRALGRLEHGRLRDPRLDAAGCATPAGDTVAFAWFEPGPDTSYVAVGQPGYVEVYPVVAGLPVRISTTSKIDLQESRVRFDVSEHDAHGVLLGSSTLDARVAG